MFEKNNFYFNNNINEDYENPMFYNAEDFEKNFNEEFMNNLNKEENDEEIKFFQDKINFNTFDMFYIAKSPPFFPIQPYDNKINYFNDLPLNSSNSMNEEKTKKKRFRNDASINKTTSEKTAIQENIPNNTKEIEKKLNIHFFVNKKEEKEKNKKKDKSPHTKYDLDNIMTKIKKRSKNNYKEFLNNELKNSENETLKTIKIEDIDEKVFNVYKKEENLDLIKKPMKDIFSNEISLRFKNKNIYHNKNAIDKIIEQNDEAFNVILNTKYEDILKIYSGDIKKKYFENFKTINDDIDFLNKEDKDYIELYKNVLKNFKALLEKIHQREKRKKKGESRIKKEEIRQARREKKINKIWTWNLCGELLLFYNNFRGKSWKKK